MHQQETIPHFKLFLNNVIFGLATVCYGTVVVCLFVVGRLYVTDVLWLSLGS